MTVFHRNRHSVKTHRETDSGYRKAPYSLTDQYPEKPTEKFQDWVPLQPNYIPLEAVSADLHVHLIPVIS